MNDLPSLVPQSVAVVFPAFDGIIQRTTDYSITISLTSLNLPQFRATIGTPWTHTLHRCEQATFLGGTGNDWDLQEPIAATPSGDVYRCGGSDSLDYPVNRAFQPALAGSHDVVITKLNSHGTRIAWSSTRAAAWPSEARRTTSWS